LIPRSAANVGLYTPNATTGTFTTGPAATGYIGGVLLPDGRVVFVPFGASTVGLLHSNTPASKSMCLHPFFNKF